MGLVLLTTTSLSVTSAQLGIAHEHMHRVMVATAPAQLATPASLPAMLFAQMTRVEHDRLRLELREGLHHPVKVGPLDELGFGRLTIRERRLLREQLRRQSDEAADDETMSVIADTGNSINAQPRPETSDAAIATIAVPESVDVSRPVIEPND